MTLHPQFNKMLTDIDVASKPLGEYADEVLRATSVADAVRIITSIQGGFSANGLSPAVSQLVESKLSSFFYQRMVDAALIVRSLDKAKPKLVILHNDVEPILRTVALWAQKRGVPCLHIPHAIYLEHDERTSVGTDIHDLITASHIAVAGSYQHDWFIERKVDTSAMRITGLPQFDRLAATHISHDRACRLLKMDTSRPVVVYMGSWRQDTNLLGCTDVLEEAYAAFLGAAKQLPELQYIVKCHPRGQNVEDHVKKADEAGIRCAVTDQHLDVILNAADTIVNVGTSNVILEAAYMQPVPMICLGGGAFPNDPEITKVATVTTDSVAQAIRDSLTTGAPDMHGFVTKYLGNVDGKASERIVEWAKELHNA